jgi:periplasmic divalent cation tolerance protein
MIAKTTETRLADLIARAKSLHSYSCPCIVSLKVEDGYPPFLQWVEGSVKEEAN